MNRAQSTVFEKGRVERAIGFARDSFFAGAGSAISTISIARPTNGATASLPIDGAQKTETSR
jgi:hypothetical protein